jgi:feruloyl-CoA synthase
VAQRDASGEWSCLTYAQTLDRVRRIAQGLLDRRLSPERSLVILSGNSIEHALLAFAAIYAGVLYAPLAPAYSLQARQYTTLEEIFHRMRPDSLRTTGTRSERRSAACCHATWSFLPFIGANGLPPRSLAP